MNLVAHEYVGSQDPDDPGVLVLSRFAGAAEIFHDALLINPFDTDETAEAMRKAITMPLEERKARWRNLMDVARTHSVDNWADSYLAALASHGNRAPRRPGDGGTRADCQEDGDRLLPRQGSITDAGMPRERQALRFALMPWLRSVFSGI